MKTTPEIEAEIMRLHYAAIACEQRRKDRRRPVPIELVLPAHLDDADVIPHDLGAYDE